MSAPHDTPARTAAEWFGHLRAALHGGGDAIEIASVLDTIRALDPTFCVEQALPYAHDHWHRRDGAHMEPETRARAEAVRRWINTRLDEDDQYWSRQLTRLALHSLSGMERQDLLRMGAPMDWEQTPSGEWIIRPDHRDILWYILNHRAMLDRS